jgi:hypothetical protein
MTGAAPDLIAGYLAELRTGLRVPAAEAEFILAEAEDHLRETAAAGLAVGTLVNAFLSDRRRQRGRELLTGWLPEHPDLAAVAAPEGSGMCHRQTLGCGSPGA